MTFKALSLPVTQGQDIEDAKGQLRQFIRSARTRRDKNRLNEIENAIVANIMALAAPAKQVALYVSTDLEPPTLGAIEALHQAGKKILLPKLGPKLSRDWAYYQGLEDLAHLAPQRPLEPSSGEIFSSTKLGEMDLIITPALAIDRFGTRLGQGGGWYDRALLHRNAQTPVYALCFTEEITDYILPQDVHDIGVDGVLSARVCFKLTGSDFEKTGFIQVS